MTVNGTKVLYCYFESRSCGLNPLNRFLEIKFCLLFSMGGAEGLDSGSELMPTISLIVFQFHNGIDL